MPMRRTSYDMDDGKGRSWRHLIKLPEEPEEAELGKLSVNAYEVLASRVRARKRLIEDAMQSGNLDEYNQNVLQNRKRKLVVGVPSHGKATQVTKEDAAKKRQRRRGSESRRSASLRKPVQLNEEQLCKKSKKKWHQEHQSEEWKEARRASRSEWTKAAYRDDDRRDTIQGVIERSSARIANSRKKSAPRKSVPKERKSAENKRYEAKAKANKLMAGLQPRD